jgi:hypothetical protein
MCSKCGFSWEACRVVTMALVRSQSSCRVSFGKEVLYWIARFKQVIKPLLLQISFIAIVDGSHSK